MNALITEKAVKAWLSDVIGDTAVILGASADTRTSPSFRIICTSCLLPNAFQQASMERTGSVIVAVLANADDTGAEETVQTLMTAAQERMNALKDEVVSVEDEGKDVLFHATFLEDQATENENSILLYGATYQFFYAYNEVT